MKNIKKRRLAGAIAVIAILAICSLMLCSYIDSPDIPPDNDENGIAQPSERFIEQIKAQKEPTLPNIMEFTTETVSRW